MTLPEPGAPSLRVAFVFPNPRAELAAAVARGEAPDSTLLGQNHMASHGIDGSLHDPWLTRRVKGDTPLHRVAWNLRELLLPFELTDADAVFTPLAAAFPLVARVRRLPVVVVNYGLCLIHERAGAARRRLLAANLKAARSVLCLGSRSGCSWARYDACPPEDLIVCCEQIRRLKVPREIGFDALTSKTSHFGPQLGVVNQLQDFVAHIDHVIGFGIKRGTIG